MEMTEGSGKGGGVASSKRRGVRKESGMLENGKERSGEGNGRKRSRDGNGEGTRFYVCS